MNPTIYLGLALIAAGLATAVGTLFFLNRSLNRYQSPTFALLSERYRQLEALVVRLEKGNSFYTTHYRPILDDLETHVFRKGYVWYFARSKGSREGPIPIYGSQK